MATIYDQINTMTISNRFIKSFLIVLYQIILVMTIIQVQIKVMTIINNFIQSNQTILVMATTYGHINAMTIWL